jgi:hypothetical protein
MQLEINAPGAGSPNIYLWVIFTPKNKGAFYSASGKNPLF